MYNKRYVQQYGDKKVLHKVRKHWVTVSLALLMMIGGGAVVAHANTVDPVNQINTSNIIKSNNASSSNIVTNNEVTQESVNQPETGTSELDIYTRNNEAYGSSNSDVNTRNNDLKHDFTNIDGFLTANTWYRPQMIHQNGNNWVQNSGNDYRPILMNWWPDKNTQVNYLNYMQQHGLISNNYSVSNQQQQLNDGSHAVQDKLEQNISANNDYINSTMKPLFNNFVSTQPQWNSDSEPSVPYDIQGGFLKFQNSKLTPYSNTPYRLFGRNGSTYDRLHNNNNDMELLVSNDIDNSNPSVISEDLNNMYYIMNIGSVSHNSGNIPGSYDSANFDGARIDAPGSMDYDAVDATQYLMNDLFKRKHNDINANNHLEILEDALPWVQDLNTMQSNRGAISQDQISLNQLNKCLLSNHNIGFDQVLTGSDYDNYGKTYANRINDYTEDEALPNYSKINYHDNPSILNPIQNIANTLRQNNSDLSLLESLHQAVTIYENDENNITKHYSQEYNVPAGYALTLTNKDTIPELYYGDLYRVDSPYMSQHTLYYNAINALLKARKKYVAGGQQMRFYDNGHIMSSVRFGADGNFNDSYGGHQILKPTNDDSSKPTTGIAVVLNNTPNYEPKQGISVYMGDAHKNQQYKALMESENDTNSTIDDFNYNSSERLTTDSSGYLHIPAADLKGYVNPQNLGNLSVWVPTGASNNQDVRTLTQNSTPYDNNYDDYIYHSNATLDSHILYESFSPFMQIHNSGFSHALQNPTKINELKDMGITDFRFPPIYKPVVNDTSFIDATDQNGYAFQDRYQLGGGKYGSLNQLLQDNMQLHNQGIHTLADIVDNQIYDFPNKEIVPVKHTDYFGNLYPSNNSHINHILYADNSMSNNNELQFNYGGKYLNQLHNLYPDLFNTKMVSSEQTLPYTNPIKIWSAKYENGSNIQGRGTGYVLKNTSNGQYYNVNNIDLPSSLLNVLPIKVPVNYPQQNTDTINYQYDGNTVSQQYFTGNAWGSNSSNMAFQLGSHPAGLPTGFRVINPNQWIAFDGGSHYIPINADNESLSNPNQYFINNNPALGDITRNQNFHYNTPSGMSNDVQSIVPHYDDEGKVNYWDVYYLWNPTSAAGASNQWYHVKTNNFYNFIPSNDSNDPLDITNVAIPDPNYSVDGHSNVEIDRNENNDPIPWNLVATGSTIANNSKLDNQSWISQDMWHNPINPNARLAYFSSLMGPSSSIGTYLAYENPGDNQFHPYNNRPVISTNTEGIPSNSDFRDVYVTINRNHDGLIAYEAGGLGHRVYVLTSNNGINWQPQHDLDINLSNDFGFGNNNIIETPNIQTINGHTVMFFGCQDAINKSHEHVCYVTGQRNSNGIFETTPSSKYGTIDHGFDNYAGGFTPIDNNSSHLMYVGWLGNWNYFWGARRLGSYSIPRILEYNGNNMNVYPVDPGAAVNHYSSKILANTPVIANPNGKISLTFSKPMSHFFIILKRSNDNWLSISLRNGQMRLSRYDNAFGDFRDANMDMTKLIQSHKRFSDVSNIDMYLDNNSVEMYLPEYHKMLTVLDYGKEMDEPYRITTSVPSYLSSYQFDTASNPNLINLNDVSNQIFTDSNKYNSYHNNLILDGKDGNPRVNKVENIISSDISDAKQNLNSAISVRNNYIDNYNSDARRNSFIALANDYAGLSQNKLLQAEGLFTVLNQDIYSSVVDVDNQPNYQADIIHLKNNGNTVGNLIKAGCGSFIANSVTSDGLWQVSSDNQQEIPFDGRGHDIDVVPKEVSDLIEYQYNGQTLGEARFSGNIWGSNLGTTAFQLGNNPIGLPSGYHLTDNESNQWIAYDGSSNHPFDIERNIPRVTDTVNYIYNGKTVGSHQFSGNAWNTNSTNMAFQLGTHPAGLSNDYKVPNPNDWIAYDGNTHDVNVILSNQMGIPQATDTVNYQYNGQTVGSHQFTGNAWNSQSQKNHTSHIAFQLGNMPVGLPSGYHITDPSAWIAYDGNTHNANVVANQLTDTVNYQHNGQTIGSHQFTGNAFGTKASNTAFQLNSKPVGLPNGYKVVDPSHWIAYDGNVHNINVESTPVNPQPQPNPAPNIPTNNGGNGNNDVNNIPVTPTPMPNIPSVPSNNSGNMNPTGPLSPGNDNSDNANASNNVAPVADNMTNIPAPSKIDVNGNNSNIGKQSQQVNYNKSSSNYPRYIDVNDKNVYLYIGGKSVRINRAQRSTFRVLGSSIKNGKNILSVEYNHKKGYFYSNSVTDAYYRSIPKNSKYVRVRYPVHVYNKPDLTKNHQYGYLKAGTKVKVDKIIKDGNITRFQLANGKYITANKYWTKFITSKAESSDNYYRRIPRHYHYVTTLRPVHIYSGKKFSDDTRRGIMRKGITIRINKLIKYNGITRFKMMNGKYITSNKNWVKLTK